MFIAKSYCQPFLLEFNEAEEEYEVNDVQHGPLHTSKHTLCIVDPRHLKCVNWASGSCFVHARTEDYLRLGRVARGEYYHFEMIDEESVMELVEHLEGRSVPAERVPRAAMDSLQVNG
ncbi:MAG: hypothetical protein Q9218_007931 [Villophora microphyllina]